MTMLWLVEGTEIREVPTKRVSGDTGWCYVLDRANDETPHYAKMGEELFYDRGTAVKEMLDRLHLRLIHGEDCGELIDRWIGEFKKERGKDYIFLSAVQSGDDA